MRKRKKETGFRKDNKFCIYQIFSKASSRLPFPYPPVCQEQNTDYLCFTDRKDVISSFWNVIETDDLEKNSLSKQLSQYTKVCEIQENQIIVGSLFHGTPPYEPVMTIPSIYDLPELAFDKNKFVHTSDESGNYIYKKNPVYTNGSYNGRRLLLTIGVPVSNQIGSIHQCLSGIRPLLELLDAELLVMNTGSTDGTVEVCRTYGARIIEVPWSDNMSAVRNAGIRHALGEWYLSIDDDEWFENVDDILNFFLRGTYLKYDSATYIQRNYNTLSGETYFDSHTLRMARITPELHFEGRIHDALIISKDAECYQLFSYAHHYGFVKDDVQKVMQKYKRNVSLLLFDIYEYPTQLRYNYQLAKEMNAASKYKEAEAFFVRGISVEREQRNPFYGKNHAIYLLAVLYNAKDSRIFSIADELKNRYSFTLAERSFFHYMLAEMGLLFDHAPEEIIGNCHNYMHYKALFKQNPAESLALTNVGLEVCTNEAFEMDVRIILFCALCVKGEERAAKKALMQIVPEKAVDQRKNFCRYFFYASDEVFSTALDQMSSVQYEVLAEELLEVFCEEKKEIPHGEERFSQILRHLSMRAVDQYFQKGWKLADQNAADRTFQWAMRCEPRNCCIQELYFYSVVLKRKLAEIDKESVHMEIFMQFIQVTGKFAQYFYQPLLLDDYQNNAISGDTRAAYHIYLALEDNSVNCKTIIQLRRALEIFPGFRSEIQYLLEEFNRYL